jgi:hypothetical protein
VAFAGGVLFSGDAGDLFVATYRARKAARQQPEADETEKKSSEIPAKKPAPSYWIQQLSKERPDFGSRVIAGEISCYAGCLEVGIRKRPAKKWTKPEDHL